MYLARTALIGDTFQIELEFSSENKVCFENNGEYVGKLKDSLS